MRRHATAALAALALLAALATPLTTAGCGAAGPRPTTFGDPEHQVSLNYDATQFRPQTALATEALLRRLHEAAGVEPLAVYSFADPAAPGNGFRLAVFERPEDFGRFSLWAVGDQAIPEVLPQVRAALGAEGTIADPTQLTYAGMKGYGTLLTFIVDGRPIRAYGFAFANDRFMYELIVEADAASFARLGPALLQPLWSLRTGGDAVK